MSRLRSVLTGYFVIGLMILGVAGQTDAQTRRTEREVRDIVRSLRSKIDDFQYNLTFQVKNNSGDTDEIGEIENDLRDLGSRINEFETNLDRRRDNRDDVSRILDAARNVNDYLTSNPQNRRIENEWTGVRTLLDRLAAKYNATGNWNGGNSGAANDDDDRYPSNNPTTNGNDYPANNYPTNRNTATSSGLTGTYRLDAARSRFSFSIFVLFSFVLYSS